MAGACRRRAIGKGFFGTQPGDRALLIYNGHGLQDQNDSAENTQRLWNDTKLQDFILSHPHYPELVAKQDRRAALEFEEISNLDRGITQLDKILRLRNLARLQSQFERHATEVEHGGISGYNLARGNLSKAVSKTAARP